MPNLKLEGNQSIIISENKVKALFVTNLHVTIADWTICCIKEA